MTYDFSDEVFGELSTVELRSNGSGGVEMHIDGYVPPCVLGYELRVEGGQMPVLVVAIGVRSAKIDPGVANEFRKEMLSGTSQAQLKQKPRRQRGGEKR